MKFRLLGQDVAISEAAESTTHIGNYSLDRPKLRPINSLMRMKETSRWKTL